jgi:hypothetical protein
MTKKGSGKIGKGKGNKKDTPVNAESIKGLKIILESLKKQGFKDDSKEIKNIQELLKKQ